MALERYLSPKLVIESKNFKEFRKILWTSNNFMGNIANFLKGDDNRKKYNLLRLMHNVVGWFFEIEITCELFDTLSLILSQRKILHLENEERNWVYLISKNRREEVDHGVLRLINSFLYLSRKETIIDISYYALEIMATFIGENSPKVNILVLFRIYIFVLIEGI